MIFNKKQEKLFCPRCGYGMIKPFPKICPQCMGALDEVKEDHQQALNEEKREEVRKFDEQLHAKAVEKSQLAPKEFQTSTESAADKIKGVKVLKKKEAPKIDFAQPIIEFQPGKEYVKFMGAVDENRITLFSSNVMYDYFLELSCNLSDIATSILGGELDRMILYSEELRMEEKCLFLKNDSVIYVIYGAFPEKKGTWVLSRMRNELVVLLKSIGKPANALDKMDLHAIDQKYKNACKGILDEYFKLQEVFSDKPIPSIDQTVRVDYFGMSYQSIGVISKILGADLVIKGIEAPDPAMLRELQESLVTAKLEAIAANTVANTRAMPRWISVKLSFQAYRFIIFEALPNGYFYQILAEGNLQAGVNLREQLRPMFEPYTAEVFKGDLGRFRPVNEQLEQFFAKRVFGK